MGCPKCGYSGADWMKREYTGFSFGAAAVAAGAEYERRRPVRDANLESDVLTPFLQALITSAASGVCIGALATLNNVTRSAVIGLAGSAGTLLLSWLILLRQSRALLWEVETVTGAEEEKPEAEPTEAPGFIETMVRQQNGHSFRLGRIPFTNREARAVASAVLRNGVPFSRRELVAVGAIADDPEHYSAIFNEMLRVGYMEKRGQGGALTDSGRDFLRQCLGRGW